MPTDLQVKGASFKSKFDFVASRFGQETAAKLKDRFADKGLFPILEGAWYPASLYEEVHRVLAELCFDGDLSRLTEVGAASAKSVLTGVYSAFASGRDTQRLLNVLPNFHQRVFNTGNLVVEGRSGDEEITLRLSGPPVRFEASMIQAAGFFAGLFRYIGHTRATCTLSYVADEAHFALRLDG